MAWNRNALRQLLGQDDQGVGPVRSSMSNYNSIGTEKEPGAPADLWWPTDGPIAETKASVIEESPTWGGLKTLYGACTRAIALEGDLWDLPLVRLQNSLINMLNK
jgi:hypothetical protein